MFTQLAYSHEKYIVIKSVEQGKLKENTMTKRRLRIIYFFIMCKLEVLIYFYLSIPVRSLLTWVQITTELIFWLSAAGAMSCGKSKLPRGGGDVSHKHESLASVTLITQAIMNNTVLYVPTLFLTILIHSFLFLNLKFISCYL